MAAEHPIVIAYDGSDAARAAVRHAGALCAPRAAVIVSVWEPALTEFLLMPAPDGMGTVMMPHTADASREVDAALRDHATALADDGVELARSVGLTAEPLAVPDAIDPADAIVTIADERDAAAIVVGSRGLKGLRSKLLGSTSSAVLKRAGRPVVIVRDPTSADGHDGAGDGD